jgi:hypothetical protein
MIRALTLAVVGASLAGCAVYSDRPHGYGYGGGYGSRPYAYADPSWGERGYGGRYRYGNGGEYGYGSGYGGGWGYRGGWR